MAEEVAGAHVDVHAGGRRRVEEGRDAISGHVRQEAALAVRSDDRHDGRGPAESTAAGRHDARAPASPRHLSVKRPESFRRANREAAGADTQDEGQGWMREGFGVTEQVGVRTVAHPSPLPRGEREP